MKKQRYRIHASLLAALTLLGNAGALAQSRAVDAMNFELGFATQDIDTSDSASSGEAGLRAVGTIPLGRHFGASVSASYADASIRTREILANPDGSTSNIRSSCSFEGTDGSVTLFARRPTLGKLAVSYGLGRLSSNCGEDSVFVRTGENTLRTDNYRIDAELYVSDFTLAASRSSTDLDGGPKLESNSVSASWYALDSLRVSVSGNDLYEQTAWGVALEHQPQFLGDAVGVQVGYATTDGSPRSRTIDIGIAYYFGTRVELKARDRQYR